MNNPTKALLLGLCLVVGSKLYNLATGPLHPTNDKSIASTSAMITNMASNSGGTGVVYQSTNSESKILTNAHVCGVVKNGGLVSTNKHLAMVSSYKVSQLHDLCMISVRENLGINTEVASSAPELYSPAIISGHPALLPTLITKGHFSEKEIINVMIGMKKCEKEDFENPDYGPLCMFLGFLPKVRTYRAQVVSPTIMPGSSGSAVFNDSGRISGLVFAGQGELGYGHIVPWEYVYYFVNEELDSLPNNSPGSDIVDEEHDAKIKLRKACQEKNSTEYKMIEPYCETVNDLIFEE